MLNTIFMKYFQNKYKQAKDKINTADSFITIAYIVLSWKNRDIFSDLQKIVIKNELKII